jgi:hypothetical protein
MNLDMIAEDASSLIKTAKDPEAFLPHFQNWLQTKCFQEVIWNPQIIKDLGKNRFSGYWWDELVLKESLKKADEMVWIKSLEADLYKPTSIHPWLKGPWNFSIHDTLKKHTVARLEHKLYELGSMPGETASETPLKFNFIDFDIEPDKESYLGYWVPPQGQGNYIAGLCYSQFKLTLTLERTSWVSLSQLHDQGEGTLITDVCLYQLPEWTLYGLTQNTDKKSWHFEPDPKAQEL